MTLALTGKLLRDVRLTLLGVAFLLGGFQVFWYKTTDRVIGELSPFFTTLASVAGLSRADVESRVFEGGPAKLAKTIIGGDRINFDGVMDMLSIGYVHPLMQVLFCIWAVGRAAGAIAGELDRGTMELLLAQPLARWRIILAHFCVDALTIPLLCLSLWGGTALGYAILGPIRLRPVELPTKPLTPNVLAEGELLRIGAVRVGTYKAEVKNPLNEGSGQRKTPEEIETAVQKRLEIRLLDFAPALLVVGGLLFAITGYTMTLSALGRFRWRVLGLAVFVTVLQFLINVLAQLWETAEPLRPLTIFYYYQPQQVILGQGWCVPVWGMPMPILVVLYGVGFLGYGLALWIFSRRDLPAPL